MKTFKEENISAYLDMRYGPEPQDGVGPGGGGAQPDEGKHRGDDQVVLGVALLLVQVEVRVENVQGKAEENCLNDALQIEITSTYVAEL